jgi:hypothetical protein
MCCRGRLEAIFAFEEGALRVMDVVIELAIHAYEVLPNGDTSWLCHDLRLRWRRERSADWKGLVAKLAKGIRECKGRESSVGSQQGPPPMHFALGGEIGNSGAGWLKELSCLRTFELCRGGLRASLYHLIKFWQRENTIQGGAAF